jgi:hypothetical protein
MLLDHSANPSAEDRECRLPRKRGRGGEDPVKPRVASLLGDRLAEGKVIGDEILLRHAEAVPDLGSVRSKTSRSCTRARPTRRRTSKGESSVDSWWRNSSAHAARSCEDAYHAPLAPARWYLPA